MIVTIGVARPNYTWYDLRITITDADSIDTAIETAIAEVERLTEATEKVAIFVFKIEE